MEYSLHPQAVYSTDVQAHMLWLLMRRGVSQALDVPTLTRSALRYHSQHLRSVALHHFLQTCCFQNTIRMLNMQHLHGVGPLGSANV